MRKPLAWKILGKGQGVWGRIMRRGGEHLGYDIGRIMALAFCIFSILCPMQAGADGMAFERSSFKPLAYNEQRAAILLRDGVQRMVIALNMREHEEEPKSSGTVWMFPVPGNPKSVKIDVADSFPVFAGRNIDWLLRRHLGAICAFSTYTQVPLSAFWMVVPYYMSYGASVARPEVHARVDKWGIHAELISAESIESLRNYLKQNNVSAPEQNLITFRPYLSKDYSLAVAWISSFDEIKKKFMIRAEQGDFAPGTRPCLYVEFPAEKGFYPLFPTSGYGDSDMRVSLYIVGHVTPDLSDVRSSIQSTQGGRSSNKTSSIDYYWAARGRLMKGMNFSETAPRRFGEGLADAPDYTRILLDCPAKCFVKDLFFANNPPFKVKLAGLIAGEPRFFTLGFVLAVVLCYVSGGLTGLIIFRNWTRYSFIGLWSLLTLIVLAIAFRFAEKRRGAKPKTLKFCFLFTLIFHVLVGATFFSLILIAAPGT